MGTIVGFILNNDLEMEAAKRLLASSQKALSIFPHFEQMDCTSGTSRLLVWGHKNISERCHTIPDGSLLVLVGSPHGQPNWLDVQEKLLFGRFVIPWDGRVILLHISADGITLDVME